MGYSRLYTALRNMVKGDFTSKCFLVIVFSSAVLAVIMLFTKLTHVSTFHMQKTERIQGEHVFEQNVKSDRNTGFSEGTSLSPTYGCTDRHDATCKHLTLTSISHMRPASAEWQQLKHNVTCHFYSAFWETRTERPEVRVIGLVQKVGLIDVWCHLWYQDQCTADTVKALRLVRPCAKCVG